MKLPFLFLLKCMALILVAMLTSACGELSSGSYPPFNNKKNYLTSKLLPREEFTEIAETGIHFLPYDQAGLSKNIYLENIEELSQINDKSSIRYLSLGRSEPINNYEFLREFPHLELLILPMTGMIEEEAKNSLYTNLEGLEKKQTIVVLYSSFFGNFCGNNCKTNKIAFRNIQSSCEIFRLYGFKRNVINVEKLMEERRINWYPVFKPHLKEPKLIAESKCE